MQLIYNSGTRSFDLNNFRRGTEVITLHLYPVIILLFTPFPWSWWHHIAIYNSLQNKWPLNEILEMKFIFNYLFLSSWSPSWISVSSLDCFWVVINHFLKKQWIFCLLYICIRCRHYDPTPIVTSFNKK